MGNPNLGLVNLPTEEALPGSWWVWHGFGNVCQVSGLFEEVAMVLAWISADIIREINQNTEVSQVQEASYKRQPILYCVLCISYTVFCVLSTVYFVIYCVLYAVHCLLCAVYSMLYKVYCVLYTVYCIQCIGHCVLYFVYRNCALLCNIWWVNPTWD